MSVSNLKYQQVIFHPILTLVRLTFFSPKWNSRLSRPLKTLIPLSPLLKGELLLRSSHRSFGRTEKVLPSMRTRWLSDKSRLRRDWKLLKYFTYMLKRKSEWMSEWRCWIIYFTQLFPLWWMINRLKGLSNLNKITFA